MKADFQHLGFDNVADSFLCYWVKSPMFGFHWHYHPEFEITYVHHGQGTRLVGNNVSNFEVGDMVLLGSNLPHTWISDDDFNKRGKDMEVIVLQFPQQLFSTDFLSMSEMHNINYLLSNADRGITFSDEVKKKAAKILHNIAQTSGFESYHQLLALLNLLGSDAHVSFVATQGFIPTLNDRTEERILKVCTYIHEHFVQPIKLDEVAELIFMNSTSFCRFFKRMTGQTFMEYVNDLRIGKACNLLISQEKQSISEIAHLAGFNSLALFNRIFLKKKKMTPTQFRKQFER